jgi:hypothetical protein
MLADRPWPTGDDSARPRSVRRKAPPPKLGSGKMGALVSGGTVAASHMLVACKTTFFFSYVISATGGHTLQTEPSPMNPTYGWRDEPKRFSMSSLALLLVFVGATFLAFYVGAVLKPWEDDVAPSTMDARTYADRNVGPVPTEQVAQPGP